jgi:hypothetical protein
MRVVPDRDGSGGDMERLITLIEPHCPKSDGSSPAYPLVAMRRVHLLQNWLG